jgi:hypothetical protein
MKGVKPKQSNEEEDKYMPLPIAKISQKISSTFSFAPASQY